MKKYKDFIFQYGLHLNIFLSISKFIEFNC
jgi:hypothetical protein